jgi:hypothetical protein
MGAKKYLLCRTSDVKKSTADIVPFFNEFFELLNTEWREREFEKDLDDN